MEYPLNLYLQWHRECPYTVNFIVSIGFLIFFAKFTHFVIFFYKTFLRPAKNIIQIYGSNSWVFISGSSDGIGKQLAFSFAKRGFNIVLSARTKSKLEKVSKQLLQAYPKIKVKFIAIDFKDANNQNFIDLIYNEVKDLDLSIIVNNVGVDVLSYYHQLKQQQILDLITINCLSVSLVCQKFIPILKKRQSKSCIINTGSVAGQIPIALHNVYSASKSYIDFFTRSLAHEFPQIDIICLRPSQVSTPMTYNKSLDIFTITAKQCAQGLVKDLGYGQIQSNGHWNHKIQSKIYGFIPIGLFNYVYKNIIGPSYIKQRKEKMGNIKKQQ